MGREVYEKIVDAADDVEREISDVMMPFNVAVQVGMHLHSIRHQVSYMKDDRRNLENMIEIVEGLLSNWPSTEIVEFYNPDHNRPALIKKEALKRASEALKRYHDQLER